jgi:predicted lipoprotein with Yx(FWY)xxD motif
MIRSRPITFLASALVIPLAALAIAGCGGGGAATASPPPAHPKTATKPTQPVIVRVARSGLGRILVNSHGRTLYLFKADVGTSSACTGACASAWPPLLATGNPTAGAGLTASKLGTTTRSDGTKQVTYGGHPLYLFIKDQKPGQTTGQGVTAFGAAWFAVSPAGHQVSSKPTGHGGSSSGPAASPARNTAPQPAPAPPASAPSTTTAPKPAPPPATTTTAPANSGIPQNGGGDGDSDNHGGPSDGDGNI